MASKGVVDRQRIAKAIVATARTHADEVGERLQEILAPFLPEGETPPDFTRLQLLLADYLEAQIDAIVVADEIHLKELDDDQEPRRRRDDAAAALYDTVVAVRETLAGPFGSEGADAIHGIEGTTARDPVTLERQARRMLERLTEDSLALPPSRLDGIQLDFSVLAAHLQPALDELAQAIQEVDRESREAESTIREKDNALAALDTAVSSIGRVLTGYDSLAGFSEFSDKIRLSLPNRRRRETSTDEESPVPETGDEAPAPVPGNAPPSEPSPPGSPVTEPPGGPGT